MSSDDYGMIEEYYVKIVYRDGYGQTSPDWHATVKRMSDNTELVLMSASLRLLKWRTRRAAVKRMFKSYDKHVAKTQKSFNRYV